MKTLLLIDSHALIHRAYHALPPLSTPEGEPVGALYGLTSILLKTLKDIKPDYVVAAGDRPEPTFRKEMFEDYKAHRKETADELISQITKARELFRSFNIKILEVPGYEADDIIGTLAKSFSKKGVRVIILTGDLDTLQLVRGRDVVVRAPKKGISETMTYDELAVKERFSGLGPNQMTDYKGLVGDASDNIPGVKGVGQKTAEKLLNEFGDIENLFKKISKDHPLYKKIAGAEKDALFSKKLATIETNVSLKVGLEELGWVGIPEKSLLPYLTSLGFQSLIDRVLKTTDAPVVLPQESLLPKTKRIDIVFLEEGIYPPERKKDLKDSKLKVAHDFKRIIKEARRENIEVQEPIFDLKIGGWLLDPDRNDLEFEELCRRFLRKSGNGKNAGDLEVLFNFIERKIKEYGIEKVAYEIEMRLVPILAEMEAWGILSNRKKLASLKKDISVAREKIAHQVFKISKEEFNIGSPKQVAEVLFEKLKIGEGYKMKKTSGGKQSTAEGALKKLSEDHPIVSLILKHREHSKILSTYVEPLIELSKVGRIHTTFNQTGTGTGRLSSEKPNLQNIPQESEWSERLRDSFEAEEGMSFLSFDYSQLELRLLAHLSEDKKLIEAFRNGEDVHALTASQVFGVAMSKVDSHMRRIAKALNFGIVYGMGARSFAETSGLSLEEATKFIGEYNKRFSAIKLWQEKSRAEAHSMGYIQNENGRRRWFFGINAPNPKLRADAERAAINMPTQSLSADILKLGMRKTKEVLENKKLWGQGVRLLLSIHDELLFEVHDDTLKDVIPLIKETLESVYSLKVPLVTEEKVGKTWGSVKKV